VSFFQIGIAFTQQFKQLASNTKWDFREVVQSSISQEELFTHASVGTALRLPAALRDHWMPYLLGGFEHVEFDPLKEVSVTVKSLAAFDWA
jgi:hypothetical protein